MTERPPSPSTAAAPARERLEDRVVATTAQLTASIEETLGCRLDEPTLERLLLELDRHEVVDWVTVTRTGDYVWDLSETPDQLGEAIADALVARLESWLEADD